MGRDAALVEDRLPHGIDAGRDERGRDFPGRRFEDGRVLGHRDGVEIDDAVKAVVIGLQGHEPRDGSKVIAEVQVSGRLDAGQDAGFVDHRMSFAERRDRA